MTTIILAIVAGGSLGYVLERGDLCFHSTWRGVLSMPRETELARAYLLLLLLAIPVVQTMLAFGWIDPWIPPLNLAANIGGGLIFGIGMVIAATCVTGMFYKFGHGMLGTLVALVGWALGDVFTFRGPLSDVRDELNSNPITIDGETATVNSLSEVSPALGFAGWIVLAAFGVVVARYLFRGRSLPGARRRDLLWGWIQLGVALTLVTAVAWVLVTIDGGDFSYGTAGVPATIWDWIRGMSSGERVWIPIALVSIAPGAFLAARRSGTLWVRGETPVRYAQLGIGGLIMGVGGAFAGGCNLGHSMVGVPLLSFGSMATTVAMISGILIGDRVERAIRSTRAATGVGSDQPKPAPT